MRARSAFTEITKTCIRTWVRSNDLFC